MGSLFTMSGVSMLSFVTIQLLTFSLSVTCRQVTTRPRQETCQIGEGVAVGQMDDKDMEEASGLAYSRKQSGILWTINDHGGPHSAFALGEDGKKVAQTTLKDIKNVDFEDIASTVMDGVPMILVSDTGNNDFDRDPLSILRLLETKSRTCRSDTKVSATTARLWLWTRGPGTCSCSPRTGRTQSLRSTDIPSPS